MTLLAKISCASHASRRLPHGLRIFRRFDSSRTEKSFENLVKSRKLLDGTQNEVELKHPSLITKRTITSSNVLKLARKTDEKTGSARGEAPNSSAKDNSGGRWERMDHDCKKVTKLLLAQVTTAPIRKARGPHEVKSCSSVRTKGCCQVPGSTCTTDESSLNNQMGNADHVNVKPEKEEINGSALQGKSPSNRKNLKSISQETANEKTEVDFIRDAITLSSAYITATSTLKSDKNRDYAEYIPPFFHILPKLREHEKKIANIQSEGINNSKELSQSHTSTFKNDGVTTASVKQPQKSNLKNEFQGKKGIPINKQVKKSSCLGKNCTEPQAIENNSLETTAILGTTVTPTKKDDKTPSVSKIDCQIQIPDVGKESQRNVKISSKDSTDVEFKNQNQCQRSFPAGPKCEDGKKVEGDVKVNVEVDHSKIVDTKGKEQEVAKAGTPLKCVTCKSDGKTTVKSMVQDPSKEDPRTQITDSKHKTGSKFKKDLGNAASLHKNEESRSSIDCSKFITDPKSNPASVEKPNAHNNETEDSLSQQKIDCSKYKTQKKGEGKSHSKESQPNGKVESIDKMLSKVQNTEIRDSKSDKTKKSQAPTAKGCGGVTLESGETSIDCRAINTEKTNANPGNVTVSSMDKKSDEDKSCSNGNKKARIDCSKYNLKDTAAKNVPKSDERKLSSTPGDAQIVGNGSFESKLNELERDSNELKPSEVRPERIDCSKYTKDDKTKPEIELQKPSSGDLKKGSSTREDKRPFSEEKHFSDSKPDTVSPKTYSGHVTSIPKSKDCSPLVCTKKVYKQIEPKPPKADPVKRIIVQEAPKALNYCLKIKAPEKITIEDCPMPELRNDNVIVQMKRLGICASDIFMYNQGMQKVGLNDISLGHEGVGVIVEVGSMVKHLTRGDAVVIEPGVPCGVCKFCRLGRYNICPKINFTGLLSTFVSHPAKFCHKIKKSTNLEGAALTHPLSLALHSCKKGRVSVGSKVLILGACPRGLSTVIAARTMGADRVAIIDTLERNLKVASELCADVSVLADATLSDDQLAEKALAEMKYRPNVVIDCCGCSKTVKLAVNAVEQGGHCVLAGCQAECADFPILAALAKEIKYKTSFRLANMFPRALNLIETGRANVEKMITHRVEFGEAQNAFDCAAKEDESGAVKVMIKWPEEKRQSNGETKNQDIV